METQATRGEVGTEWPGEASFGRPSRSAKTRSGRFTTLDPVLRPDERDGACLQVRERVWEAGLKITLATAQTARYMISAGSVGHGLLRINGNPGRLISGID